MTAISIDDLLSVAGEVPLSTFEWGQGLIETTNTLIGPAVGLNGLLTGKQAREVVRMLPSDVLLRVLTVRVDLKTGRLADLAGQTVEAALTATPVTVVAPATQQGGNQRQQNLLAFGAVIVITALFLLTFAVSSIKGTATPDTAVLEKVMGAIVEISREPAKPAQQPQSPPAEPAPPQ